MTLLPAGASTTSLSVFGAPRDPGDPQHAAQAPGTPRPARPMLTRRRQVGAASARSLLLTVLGEFVLPHGDPVWTSTLVSVLGRLGVEEKSARQALARTAAEGWLTSMREGRRVRWSLSPPGRRLLTEGAERIYSFSAALSGWAGEWLLLLVSVPETQRALRHRLRTRLTWAGFGSPAPGVWISPHPDREAECAAVLRELDLGAAAMSFRARFGGIGEPCALVAQAWDVDEIATLYERFIEAFGGLGPQPGDPVLLAQTRLVHEWRRFPFLDPRLPEELLPTPWIGARAAALFRSRHADWTDDARRRWRELAAAAD
jgi:phenylacetic acid degradation operon negative regulatory protein